MKIQIEKNSTNFDDLELSRDDNNSVLKETLVINITTVSPGIFTRKYIVNLIKSAQKDGKLQHLWINKKIEELNHHCLNSNDILYNLEFVLHDNDGDYHHMIIRVILTNKREINEFISLLIRKNYGHCTNKNVTLTFPLILEKEHILDRHKPLSILGDYVLIYNGNEDIDHWYVFNIYNVPETETVIVYTKGILIDFLKKNKDDILNLLISVPTYSNIKNLVILPKENISDEFRPYPKPEEVYRHFKGNMYQVLFMVRNAETEDYMIVYKSLVNGANYVRSAGNFMSKVDKEKYPEIDQYYRFERVYPPIG